LPEILRVALIGPESSGKTTLAQQLHEWLTSQGVPSVLVAEQGRVLAEDLPSGHKWSYREQMTTSLMHTAAESRACTVLRATRGRGVVLLDGTNATPAVWHLCAQARRPGYDSWPARVRDRLLDAVQEYDLTLLTAPDLPWVPDGVRDDPSGRDAAFDEYLRLCPGARVIRGAGRLAQGRAGITDLLGAQGRSGLS
jgi:nicotinamide riboside kinase